MRYVLARGGTTSHEDRKCGHTQHEEPWVLAWQSESVPVLDTLRAWLCDTIDKMASTVLGKAMG